MFFLWPNPHPDLGQKEKLKETKAVKTFKSYNSGPNPIKSALTVIREINDAK